MVERIWLSAVKKLTRELRLKGIGIVAAVLASTMTWILPAQGQKTIVTTISQIGQPLSLITGKKVSVQTLMKQGVDPHLYRLTRSDIKKLVHADLIVYNGLDLEAQMTGMMAQFAKHKPVVSVGDSLPKNELLYFQEKYHDPHIWMAPLLWKRAIGVAIDAIVELDPQNAHFYRVNAAKYFERLSNLDIRTRAEISTIPRPNRVLVTAHDAFGYFGRSYGLEVLAVQGMSTESEPGIKKIEDLVNTLVERRIGAVFVETTVSNRNLRALIEGAAAQNHIVKIGGSIFSDAMGTIGSYTGTYIGMFSHNVATIVSALGGRPHEQKLSNQFAQKKPNQ